MITRLKLSTIEQGLPKYRSMLAGNDAYIPTSFESIATATGTGSSGTITFNSIPGTYQHLQIRALAQDSNTNDFAASYDLRFNNDSGTNYAKHRLFGEGSYVAADGQTSSTRIRFDNAASRSATANTMGVGIIDILDYASTTKNKTVRGFTGADNNLAANDSYFVTLTSGLWLSTSAITRIDLIAGNNFTTRTTFALYGIKGA